MSIIDTATGFFNKKVGEVKQQISNRVDQFSTEGAGKYNVNNLVYPTELTTDPDMQHYVTFFINVRGKSKVYKENQASVVGEVSTTGENRLDPTKMGNPVMAAGALGGAVAGLGIGKKLGTIAKLRATGAGKSNAKGNAVGVGVTAAATGVGAAVGAAVASFAVKADTTYRIKDCITLHLSQSPSVHYGASYDVAEIGALGGVLAGGSSMADSVKAWDQFTEGAKALARGSASLGNAKAMMEAASKETLNPFREVLFKSVGFRKFAFDYRFFPKSQQETDAIQKIINTFKYHMHPELSAGGLYYIHPSEFNIQYYFKGKENKYFNKISTCVLEDLHVDYGGQEGVSSFKDGAPVEIGMRLVFQEIETLTKERIEKGF